MPFKVEDFLEELGIPGIAAGVGAVILAPVIVPGVAKASKPVAKAVIKAGIIAYTKSRSAIAETGEILEDLVAEVKADLSEEGAPSTLESVDTYLEES